MSKGIEKISEFDKFGSVLGLERVQELLKRLGNPHENLKIIHIAGTNGKGSVSRFVYDILREKGYKVGVYTSPFLEVFNERIEFDGEYITDDELEFYADKASKIAKDMCDDGLLSPTEFDVVTAIGFMYFADKNADFVILEVGLGGREDSTNVIEKPISTVITSISKDHTDRLGDTLTQIAYEKAGIIKENIPIISGVTEKEAETEIERIANIKNAPIIEAYNCQYQILEESYLGSVFSCKIGGTNFDKVKIKMAGRHQIRNAIVALNVIEDLCQRDICNIEKEIILKGISKTVNKGRFEVLDNNPITIIDGAHNEAGMQSFVDLIKREFPNKKILTVIGVLKDKDIENIISEVSKINCDFIATEPNNPRKLNSRDLANVLTDKGCSVIFNGNIRDAIEVAFNNKKEYNVILFVGSLYLIGEIRRIVGGSK